MTYREAALKAAIADLGVTEHPPGSNWGPRVSQYLKAAGVNAPAPWCMAAVHFWFKEAGLELTYPNEASVGFFREWADKQGYVVRKPQRGDVVCYQFDKDNWPDHVGIVESVSTDNSIHAIEGNTAFGNDANGGTVMRRIRTISRCAFVRIPGEKPVPPAVAKANRKRLTALRAWIAKQRKAGWSWARIKRSRNWSEFKRRGGK